MTAPRIETGKAVFITYMIRDARGEIFEMSDVPIGYVHGAGGRLFETIETALEGKGVGDRVEVTLSPEEGFGYPNPELQFTDDIENVPEELRHLGAQLQAENDKGEVLDFRVTQIDDGTVTVDANHPLAGQRATFLVTVVAIRDATPDEIRTGEPGGPPVTLM